MVFVSFEISEIGHWVLFVIWLLQFVISSLAQKTARLYTSGTKYNDAKTNNIMTVRG